MFVAFLGDLFDIDPEAGGVVDCTGIGAKSVDFC
jgi:hypothetical protein